MSHVSTITAARRWLPVALAVALAACSGKEESAAPAAATA
ncbi:energy transducer TonB, partial [Stenotrophomonas geniculata]